MNKFMNKQRGKIKQTVKQLKNKAVGSSAFESFHADHLYINEERTKERKVGNNNI